MPSSRPGAEWIPRARLKQYLIEQGITKFTPEIIMHRVALEFLAKTCDAQEREIEDLKAFVRRHVTAG